MSTDEGIANLFSREGHLTELSLDRFQLGELDAPRKDAVQTHLGQCESCRQAVEGLAAFDRRDTERDGNALERLMNNPG